jgi:hypothetical protein
VLQSRAVLDHLHQQQLTRRLQHFSARLDELIPRLRPYSAQDLPSELIDELAALAGELMLALIDHRGAFRNDGITGGAVADARLLREGLRSERLPSSQVAEAATALRREVDEIIRGDKRAA